MANIIVYTTDICPWCIRVKEFLNEHKIKYTEKNVQRNEAYAKEMINKSGQMGVPVIIIDDEAVVGFDKERLKKLLRIK